MLSRLKSSTLFFALFWSFSCSSLSTLGTANSTQNPSSSEKCKLFQPSLLFYSGGRHTDFPVLPFAIWSIEVLIINYAAPTAAAAAQSVKWQRAFHRGSPGARTYLFNDNTSSRIGRGTPGKLWCANLILEEIWMQSVPRQDLHKFWRPFRRSD